MWKPLILDLDFESKTLDLDLALTSVTFFFSLRLVPRRLKSVTVSSVKDRIAVLSGAYYLPF